MVQAEVTVEGGWGRRPQGPSVVLRSAKACPFAERKTAIWELAVRPSIKLSAYLPPLRHREWRFVYYSAGNLYRQEATSAVSRITSRHTGVSGE